MEKTRSPSNLLVNSIIIFENYDTTHYILFLNDFDMAEADMAAFGSAIGVAIALAVVTFALRGKGHPEEPGE